MSAKIVDVRAREILDSRGDPALEVEVELAGGSVGRAAVPSGASTGTFEAVERRDGDARRYRGKGVLHAAQTVRGPIRSLVVGLDARDQRAVDERLIALDGTPTKSVLGANAILGTSLASAKAAAVAVRVPLYRLLGGGDANVLPVPLLNVVNGGAHAQNRLDLQEFMLVPAGAPTFAEALRFASETYHALRALLHERGLVTSVGDEGGFAPDLPSTEAAIEAVVEAIDRAGHGGDVVLALDAAPSALLEDGIYVLRGEDRRLTGPELIDLYDDLCERFPIVSIEDGLGEDEWEDWATLTARLGDRIQLIGDDLFVTNVDRLRRGVESGVANAILIKPNQVGTLTETLDTIAAARAAGYGVVVSHRSGETEDTTIADLAVAVGAGQLKAGAPARGERVAKHNRLLRIEEELGANAVYAGWSAFPRARRPVLV